MEKENILGVDVCVTNYESLKRRLIKDIEERRKSFLVAINPEKILKAMNDDRLNNLLNSATYQIPDGIGVIMASKVKKGNIKSRVTGIDCMNMICSFANDIGTKVFLYGAKPGIADKAAEVLKDKYPQLNIVGKIDGYEKDQFKIIDSINKSGAEVLFVALGSPNQEYWITNNMDKVNVNIFQGVGGSFDVISGNLKRAPKWMQDSGLEWLYRLIKEPTRVTRQFKLLNFLFLVAKERRNNKS